MNLLDRYKTLLDFLSFILGDKTEIVLQDFTNGFDNSLVYIKNNLSGRQIGAPATDLVLEIYNSKIYKEKDYILNYRTKSSTGNELYSSSFFIKNNDDNLDGMICINSDKTEILNLRNTLINSLEIINKSISEEQNEDKKEIKERFYNSSEQIILDAINEKVNLTDLNNVYKLKKKEKLAIVDDLYKKGFFHLKDAISKVAETFNMSEVSIYKYIQEVK